MRWFAKTVGCITQGVRSPGRQAEAGWAVTGDDRRRTQSRRHADVCVMKATDNWRGNQLRGPGNGLRLLRSAPHKGFSRLSLRINCCISSLIGDRHNLTRDFHRQQSRNAVRCQQVTVAGCITWAQSCHASRDLDRITHSTRKPAVNRGRGSFFSWMRCLQTANWLSAARSRTAKTALGCSSARRKVTAYLRIWHMHRRFGGHSRADSEGCSCPQDSGLPENQETRKSLRTNRSDLFGWTGGNHGHTPTPSLPPPKDGPYVPNTFLWKGEKIKMRRQLQLGGPVAGMPDVYRVLGHLAVVAIDFCPNFRLLMPISTPLFRKDLTHKTIVPDRHA